MSDTALKIKLKLDTREANRSLEKLGEQCDGILEEFRNEAVEADSFKQVNAVVNELDKYSKSVSENLSKAKKELDSIVSQRGELEKSLGEKRRLGDTAGSNADTAKIKELNSQEKYLAQDIEDQKASLRETETVVAGSELHCHLERGERSTLSSRDTALPCKSDPSKGSK